MLATQIAINPARNVRFKAARKQVAFFLFKIFIYLFRTYLLCHAECLTMMAANCKNLLQMQVFKRTKKIRTQFKVTVYALQSYVLCILRKITIKNHNLVSLHQTRANQQAKMPPIILCVDRGQPVFCVISKKFTIAKNNSDLIKEHAVLLKIAKIHHLRVLSTSNTRAL